MIGYYRVMYTFFIELISQILLWFYIYYFSWQGSAVLSVIALLLSLHVIKRMSVLIRWWGRLSRVGQDLYMSDHHGQILGCCCHEIQFHGLKVSVFSSSGNYYFIEKWP